MKTFKTPKGTELPIMDIKGKDYLQAAPRIVWFREEKPEWGIETEFLSLSDSHAVCRATIRNETGRIIAQATSMETKQGFESFVEKAETCAVSRAASFCNFGTLMAQELEEQGKLDERENSGSAKLAESPQQAKGNASRPQLKAVQDLGSFEITFGKNKGKTFEKMGVDGVLQWKNSVVYALEKEGKRAEGKLAEALDAAENFLISRHPNNNRPTASDEIPY